MSRAPRRLVSVRRSVPPGARAAYDAAWDRLRAAAGAASAHAWRFHAEGDPRLFLEFLEFAPGGDPRDAPGGAAAARALDDLSPAAASEAWVEVRDDG